MWKKILMAILPVCVAAMMTACGGKTDTAEVKETAATEESAEAEAQAKAEAEAEAEAKAREEAEEQARLAEAGECYEAGRKSLYGLDGAKIDLEDAYTNFTKARELGNTDANFYLGALCDWYDYPEKDYEQAREYYEQCEDNPYAQISLGFLYYNSQVEWKDGLLWEDVPKLFFQPAIDQGVADGYLGLAAVAKNEGDYAAALEDYQKAAEEGTEQLYVVSAMKSIGYLYQYGDSYGVEQDGAKAIEWFTKAADLGDLEAMNRIALIYWRGEADVAQDVDAAIEWFTKAADLGDSDAMNYLGAMHHNGDGVEEDFGVAMEWFRKAADLGHAQAMSNIAYMYRYGNGVAQDGAEAVEWYQKAADSDFSSALYDLGDMYRNGEGVEQDDDKALEWYMKFFISMPSYDTFLKMADILHGEDAALKWFEESGDAEKMIALGNMYRSFYNYYGENLFPDFDKAIEWYTKAAELGNPEAMKMLGFMYEMAPVYNGEQDLDKSAEWYQKAADAGDEEAKSHLEALQEQ